MDDADLAEVLRTTRELIRERVIPHEAEIDATDEMPSGLRQEAARLGLFGFAIPEEYGGLGLSMAQEARLGKGLGYATPAFRSMVGTHNGIAGHVPLGGGTPEPQKA